jgi:1-acyl-sn-glycerol-3-phosphate acyltransferase
MRSRFYATLSVPVFAILYTFTALTVLIFLILVLLRFKKPTGKLAQIWAKGIFLLMLKKYKVQGLEYIEKKSRYILVANHSSLFDIIAIMAIYPGVSFFGHERLLKIPVFGKVLKILNYVPFKTPTVKNIKEMMDQLVITARDKTVVIFPEGTRTLDGQINNFYKGFIYLLRSGDSGILPVTLNGFYKLKPKNRSYINFNSKLEIIIHKPVKRDDIIDKSDNEIVSIIKVMIESAYQ